MRKQRYLTSEQRASIVSLVRNEHCTLAEAGRRHGVTAASAWRVVNPDRARDIDLRCAAKRARAIKRTHPLTTEERRSILALLNDGATKSEAARMYGVSYQTIWNIANPEISRTIRREVKQRMREKKRAEKMTTFKHCQDCNAFIGMATSAPRFCADCFTARREASIAASKEKRAHDRRQRNGHLLGQRFGRVIVFSHAPKANRFQQWHCTCDCGVSHLIEHSKLIACDLPWCDCITRLCRHCSQPFTGPRLVEGSVAIRVFCSDICRDQHKKARNRRDHKRSEARRKERRAALAFLTANGLVNLEETQP